jgi:hypothetical protein
MDATIGRVPLASLKSILAGATGIAVYRKIRIIGLNDVVKNPRKIIGVEASAPRVSFRSGVLATLITGVLLAVFLLLGGLHIIDDFRVSLEKIMFGIRSGGPASANLF